MSRCRAPHVAQWSRQRRAASVLLLRGGGLDGNRTARYIPCHTKHLGGVRSHVVVSLVGAGASGANILASMRDFPREVTHSSDPIFAAMCARMHIIGLRRSHCGLGLELASEAIHNTSMAPTMLAVWLFGDWVGVPIWAPLCAMCVRNCDADFCLGMFTKRHAGDQAGP